MELNIIHVDMDAFYAAVEQREHPEYRGQPVIVGGQSKRGVVSTASYEAREYGIHSAQAMAKAKQLCPDGIYLRPRHDYYKQVSKKIRAVFARYTDLIEPLSLDEAYLDVSTNAENSIKIAKRIKRQIKVELDLVASVGVSYNKFLAKLASDLNKPDGFKIVSPFQAQELIWPMDVSELWGVGPKTEEELKELGLERIADVAQADRLFLIRELGKKGYRLHKLAQGQDPREVSIPGDPKSIGNETTFKQDIAKRSLLQEHLLQLSQKVAQRLQNKEVKGKTVTLKLKYEDFEVLSRSNTIQHYIDNGEEIYELADRLLEKIDLPKKVRLIGVTVSNLVDKKFEQLKLF
ncbi:DNA polymerase IV [Halanaerobacter jeridensis]|uniref:DNA polymerase IV n=1 Tax=Halanaerobacter jeridensis TaxID=706427 RepID=A0A939BRN8_9FIRM|nr:DNA polymerase IV [Halanaerobacter jeridensis]MBM7557529.1 DNA polymerase-4 [Halanaerobacter jeridensis]